MSSPNPGLKFYSVPGHHQDRWVITKVLNYKRNGFFVDAGAGPDGIKNSNTYALETQLGWKGICIEAHPARFEQIKKNRSCALENVVLWDAPDEIEFSLNLHAEGASGVVDEMNRVNRKRFYPEGVQCQALKLTGVPLAELLEKYNAPRHIDYLSMDIEGAEYRALHNFPFEQYTFGCMTIEKGSSDLANLRQLLLSKGYQLVNVQGPDDFWVNPEMGYSISLGKKLAVLLRSKIQLLRLNLR